MAGKRDRTFCGVRVDPDESEFLLRLTVILDMDDSTFLKKCIALAAPQLLYNLMCRRTSDLEDTMNGMSESVNQLWHARHAKR